MRPSFRWIFVLLAVAGLHCAPTDRKTVKSTDGGPKAVEVVVPKESDPLQVRVDAALKHIRSLPLDPTYGFWTIFHGILGLGPDNLMMTDPDTKKSVNAFSFITNGGKVRAMQFTVGEHGVDVPWSMSNAAAEVFFGQGHQDQFIAEMIQWGVPPERKFRIGAREFPFQSFFNHSKMRASVKEKQELSWAIIVVGEHFGTEHAWTNSAGEKLTMAEMLRYELDQPWDTAACGATHRLFGLTWVLYRHKERGLKVDGVFKDVAAKLEEYKNLAKKLRNPDGSFSTDYFKGPGNATDPQLRIGTTGHILEWLAFFLPDRELKEPWVQEAVGALAKMILDTNTLTGQLPVEGGAFYHAAHGLNLYNDRVWGDSKAKQPYPSP